MDNYDVLTACASAVNHLVRNPIVFARGVYYHFNSVILLSFSRKKSYLDV